jgi:uncharacterized membrane protein YoaK (UPF0700 family)
MRRVSRGWEPERDALLLALTWAAGYVDAIGYLALGGVFTANMTGNTVLLGLHVSQEQGAAVVRSLVALGGFGAGLLIGALIVERGRASGPWPAAVNQALAVEILSLGAFAASWHLIGTDRSAARIEILIALLAVAMGIQSAAVRRLGVPGIATTYMTGTLTSAVTGLVASRRAAEAPAASATPPFVRWSRGVRLQFVSLLVYGIGATIGGLAQSHGRALAAVWPLVVVLVVAVTASRRAAQASS